MSWQWAVVITPKSSPKYNSTNRIFYDFAMTFHCCKSRCDWAVMQLERKIQNSPTAVVFRRVTQKNPPANRFQVTQLQFKVTIYHYTTKYLWKPVKIEQKDSRKTKQPKYNTQKKEMPFKSFCGGGHLKHQRMQHNRTSAMGDAAISQSSSWIVTAVIMGRENQYPIDWSAAV